MTHPTKQECTDPTGHCTCYDRQGYGKCCSCKAINPNPERAVVEGTIPSNEQGEPQMPAEPLSVTAAWSGYYYRLAKYRQGQIERLRVMLERAVTQFPNDDGWLHEAKAMLWGDSPSAPEVKASVPQHTPVSLSTCAPDCPACAYYSAQNGKGDGT